MANPIKELERNVDKHFDPDRTHKDLEKLHRDEIELERNLVEMKRKLAEAYVLRSADAVSDVFLDVLGTRTVVDGIMDEGFRKIMINKLQTKVNRKLGIIRAGLMLQEREQQHDPEFRRSLTELHEAIIHFNKCVYGVFIKKYERGWDGQGAKPMAIYITALLMRMQDMFKNITAHMSNKTQRYVNNKMNLAEKKLKLNFARVA